MKTKYTINEEACQLIAERSFTAPKSKVWEAWTTAELLEQWWGPKPYDAVTHSFDFTEGGSWKYLMKGPEGDAHHCINTYNTIDPVNAFTATDVFANEDWTVREDLPTNDWTVTFTEEGDVTHVKVVTQFKSLEDLKTIVKMGMKDGFDTGLNQLEALLTS